MIVELVGCSGAGKTALGRALRESGAAANALAMPDVVLDRAGLRRMTHPTAVNLVQDFSALPYTLPSWRRQREFFAFSRKLLARGTRSRFERLNALRSILRRVGMLQLARSRASNRTVLSDEGTIGIASLLFCAPDLDLRPAELARFAQLAPLPDRIVYVRAPIASLVRRATSRRDPRRPLTRMRANQVEPMVRRTVDVFEGLAAAPQLRGRLVAVENADRKPADREEQLREIASGLRPFLAPAVAAELPVALGGRSPLQGELGP